jgi:hypothetical protein
MVGESDVPLDKDRVLEPRTREFFPTFAEWAADGHIEQILRSRTRVTINQTLYTVPENHTLFITSAWVTATETGNVSTHGEVRLDISTSGFNRTILTTPVDHITGQHGGSTSLSLSFPLPVRIEEKNTIILVEAGITSPLLGGGFVGYLLPKKISIR